MIEKCQFPNAFVVAKSTIQNIFDSVFGTIQLELSLWCLLQDPCLHVEILH